MYRIIQKIVSLICLVVLSVSAWAMATGVQPNIGRVIVPDQSSSALQKSLPMALSQVLIKMSGNPKVVEIPAIKKNLPRANHWLQSYSYQKENDGNGQLRTYAQIVFNRGALVQLLKKNGASIWENRPQTLVWLHIQQNQLSYFLAGNDHRGISIDLKSNAFRRGVAYMLPLMDEQDRTAFDLTSPTPFTEDKLSNIAERYNAPAVLAGNITQTPDNKSWQSDWHLLLNGQVMHLRQTTPDLNSALAQIIDKIADMMSASNQVVATQTVTLAVEGINNLDDYAELMKYVQTLSPISHVDVKDMRDSVVLLSISINGGIEKLTQTLTHSNYLTATSPSSETTVADIYYRWATQNQATFQGPQIQTANE